MANPRLLPTLAFWATCVALSVIALGAFTRLIDAGLGCPDWPGCYGQLTVPMTQLDQQSAAQLYPSSPFVSYKAWAEMIHRYVVGGLSCFILGIIFLITSKKIWRTRSNLFLAFALIALLAYQIILGQLTVTLKLLPIIVSQHLLGGFFIVAALWSIYLNNNRSRSYEPQRTKTAFLLPWFIIALIILLGQIALGAWTSTNYASLSCPDFPFCVNDSAGIIFHFKAAFTLFSPIGINYEGGVLPVDIRQTIQMTHRIGALVFTGYIVGLMTFAFHKIKDSVELMKSFYCLIGLLMAQICVGISNIIFKLPLVTALSHTLIAVLLLLVLLTIIFKLKTIDVKVPHP